MLERMTTEAGDFELTMDELRVVARFATESAQEVLPVFERAHPTDARPRAALDAARAFVDGGRRSALQRSAAFDAHRAAKEAASEPARLAAQAAGDAAASAYLHPIAKAHQVGHILRAAASAARVAELEAGDDPGVGEDHVDRARRRATAELIDVLSRYPAAPADRSRVGQLMSALDAALRQMQRPTVR